MLAPANKPTEIVTPDKSELEIISEMDLEVVPLKAYLACMPYRYFYVKKTPLHSYRRLHVCRKEKNKKDFAPP